MNVTLITPTPPDLDAFGVRIISSVMKERGHRTRIIFLPGGIEKLRFDASYRYQYPQKTLVQIADLCEDADLIGFSFMSHYYDRAVQITDYLKKELGTIIIWGGIHPTHRPEQALEHCDVVCIGEGEKTIICLTEKMSNGQDFTDIPSCWFKINGQLKKNKNSEIVQALDELPFWDYEIENHYMYHWRSGHVIPIDRALMRAQFLRMPFFRNKQRITYRTMTSRGCPHRCSYCASSAMMKLRRRSVDHVIDELKLILEKFDFIEQISFFDDTFFAAPIEYFEEFREKYKSEVGLPFHAQCSPTTVTREKLKLLIDCGLYYTEMGIQTGSDRIKQIYRRFESTERVIESARIIGEYSEKMFIPDYHIILDNPWETKDDVLDTLKLLLRIPGRYRLEISSLIFFPGTELNERAREEGILINELDEVCRKPFTFPKGTYLNYLIYLCGFWIVPRWLLKILSHRMLVDVLHKQEASDFYDCLFLISEKLRIASNGIAALLRGDFKRIINYFRLVR